MLLVPASAAPMLAVVLEPASGTALPAVLLTPAESLEPAFEVPILAVLLEPALGAAIPVVLLPAAPAKADPRSSVWLPAAPELPVGLEALPLCTAGDSALPAAMPVLYAGCGAAAVLLAAADTKGRAGPEEGSEGLSEAASEPAAAVGGLALPVHATLCFIGQ